MAKVTSASSSGTHLVSSDVHIVNGAVWQDTELGDDGELWVENGGTALNTFSIRATSLSALAALPQA